MRHGVQRLKGIKVIVKPNGRRYVYRRVNGQLVPLPNLPENHPAFLAAYAAAGEARTKTRAQAGTIAALCEAYMRSGAYAKMAASTRAVWLRTLSRISEKRGVGLVRDLRAEHIRKDVRAFTPGAASNRLKAWRSILSFAVSDGWIDADPSQGVKIDKGEVVPHRQWTLAEIEAYRAHWPIGTPQRCAMEVIYWTGARCVDAVHIGWQKVDRDGWLAFVQVKTGNPASCPVNTRLPRWCASLAPDQQHLLACLPKDGLQWIVTQTGKPRSVKGLSQWMSANATAAGLPADCTAHGLRKARAAALAESGATASQIGAWTGHASLAEIAHYTRAADQKNVLRGGEQNEKAGNALGNSNVLPYNSQ